MRTASILLALIVVLGFARQAVALSLIKVEHHYTTTLAGAKIGFEDGTSTHGLDTREIPFGRVYLGPLGIHEVPFTATQGLVGFCVIVVGLIALLTVFTVRWRKRAA